MGVIVTPPAASPSVFGAGGASANGTGIVTSAAAGQVIATAGALAAGIYVVKWSVVFMGTLAAIDEQNMAVFNGAGQVSACVNGINAGTIEAQPDVTTIVPSGGAVVAVKAVALATVASIYQAVLTATRVG